MDCTVPAPERQAAPQAVPLLPLGTSTPPDALTFSRPYPRCRAPVSLPWCSILSAVLDRLDALETALGALQAHDDEDLP